jgi:hyperosmotically inducible protein
MKTTHEHKPMNLSDSVFIACLSAVLGLGLAGCQQEGTAEKAGQKIDQAAENAGKKLEATKESVGEKTEKAAGYLDDSAITAKIKAEILSDPLLKSSQISVATTNGVVTLGGAVDSQQSIGRALEIVRGNQSVKSVENGLVVKGAR